MCAVRGEKKRVAIKREKASDKNAVRRRLPYERMNTEREGQGGYVYDLSRAYRFCRVNLKRKLRAML